MTPEITARRVMMLGGALFILGSILLGVGTYSVPLFIFYGLITLSGLLILGRGAKMQRQTME